MKYSIVFSSQTGNTAQLAEVVRETLSQETCIYFGIPDVNALDASVIFVGFWTDKGNCDESVKEFLKTLKNKEVFLFGTAGFGGSKEYLKKILLAVKENLDTMNHVIGSFMCQGKCPHLF